MTPQDTVSLLRGALKAGVPPIQYSVFSALISYTNWRGYCHPSQRTIAKLCSINKDTATTAIKWLSERGLIAVHPKPKCVNHYEILARSKWRLSGLVGQVKSGKLSGSTDQPTVRSGRTGHFGVLQRNCPVWSDVSKDSAQGANGNAVAFGESGDALITEESCIKYIAF
jgi:hypothetical protein